MFDNKRYMTTGIKNEIPLRIQLFMWSCIDTLKEQRQEVGYLQVFKLTKERADDIEYQLVEHRQEVPEYKKKFSIFPSEIVDAKIFIIDDGDHSTMMLAEEY